MVQPQAENHLLTVEQHVQVAHYLNAFYEETSPGSFGGWIIVCLFYSSLHYVQAYFLEKQGRSHTRHVDRDRDIADTADLAAKRLAFSELYGWSREARYNALPNLNRRIQPAFDDHREIAAEIKRLLGVR